LTDDRLLQFDGDIWHAVGGVTAFGRPTTMAVVGEHVFVTRAGYVVDNQDDAIWRLSPGADSWVRVLQNDGPTDWTYELAAIGGRIVAGRPLYGVLLSDDLGESWSRGELPFATAFAVDEGSLYSPFEFGFARSTDGGATWAGVASRNDWEPFTASRGATFDSALSASDGYVFAATSRSGLYRTRHGQAEWELIGVSRLRSPDRLVAAGGRTLALTGGAAFTISDNGSRWTRAELSSDLLGGVSADESAVYVATYFGGVRRLAGGEDDWSSGEGSVRAVSAVGGILYAGRAELLFVAAPAQVPREWSSVVRSVDGGGTWHDMSEGLPDRSGINEIAGAAGALFARGEPQHGAGEGGEWFRWSEAGWRPAPEIPRSAMLGVGDALYATTEAGVVHSQDGGATWTPFAAQLSGVSINSIVPFNGALYVGSRDGVHMSPDNGRNWRALDGGLAGSHVISMAASQRFMYASVEGAGVVRAPLPDVIASVEVFGRRLTAWGDVKEGGEAPAHTRMLPNYPSPFNPETWIPYELAVAADVLIELSDSRGAVIRRLAVGDREAGRYVGRGRAAHWDGRNDVGELVSGGVYYVTLRAGASVVTRRIVLSK
jgi:hypothetical protein